MSGEDHSAQVASRAQAEQDWQAGDVVVERLASLDADGCAVYEASHKTLPASHAPSYAVLGDGRIVSESDDDGARLILDTCGEAADARYWAEVLARFHREVAPGRVLYDADEAGVAVRKATAAGHPFHAPAFAPADGKVVEFFLMNFESSQLYRIKAGRAGDGTFNVSKERAS